MSNFDLAHLQKLYMDFLQNFPGPLQPIISLLLAALIVYAVIQILRKDFIYLILLVVLLPASIPILRNLADTIIQFIRFLIPG
jgi:hypothetical protein